MVHYYLRRDLKFKLVMYDATPKCIRGSCYSPSNACLRSGRTGISTITRKIRHELESSSINLNKPIATIVFS